MLKPNVTLPVMVLSVGSMRPPPVNLLSPLHSPNQAFGRAGLLAMGLLGGSQLHATATAASDAASIVKLLRRFISTPSTVCRRRSGKRSAIGLESVGGPLVRSWVRLSRRRRGSVAIHVVR